MSESGDQDDAEKSLDATEQKLRKAREKGKWTIEECAEYVGVTRDAWYKWETGQRWPTSEQQLDRIAETVGVTASQLLKE